MIIIIIIIVIIIYLLRLYTPIFTFDQAVTFGYQCTEWKWLFFSGSGLKGKAALYGTNASTMLCYEQSSSLRGRSGWGFVDPGSCGWSKCKIMLAMPLCLIPAPAFRQHGLNAKAIISVHAAVSLLCLMCGEALSDYCLIPITVLRFRDSALVLIERCWQDGSEYVFRIFPHRDWKEFLHFVFLLVVFFLFFFLHFDCSSSAYFRKFIFFYTWGQVGKKETLWKSERVAQLRKTKSFQGRGMKAKGMQTQNHLWSFGLARAFFFPPSVFFPSLFSLPLSRQPGRAAAYCDHSLSSIEHWDSQYISTFASESHLECLI